jgi:hypothetical protein
MRRSWPVRRARRLARQAPELLISSVFVRSVNSVPCASTPRMNRGTCRRMREARRRSAECGRMGRLNSQSVRKICSRRQFVLSTLGLVPQIAKQVQCQATAFLKWMYVSLYTDFMSLLPGVEKCFLLSSNKPLPSVSTYVQNRTHLPLTGHGAFATIRRPPHVEKPQEKFLLRKSLAVRCGLGVSGGKFATRYCC